MMYMISFRTMNILISIFSIGMVDAQPADKWTEKELIQDLLKDYDKHSRPVVDGVSNLVQLGKTYVQQITVAFGLGLIQILQLNENEQILTVSVRSLYRWTDHHLVWNPEDYENITHINIPIDKIWLPDVSLYNYADERFEEKRECAVRVDHNGVIEWHPMAIYKSTCPVKIKYFPYDKQICKMRFGPWSFDSARLNITFYDDGFNMKDYVTSPEWDLLEFWKEHRTLAYPCCPESYSDVLFYIKIERQAAYYNYILILPCFLLSSLTLVLFWLPPETPAKMVLGMNIFLAFFLLLLLLENSIPSASSSFPLIGNYYCINMTLVTLSTFLCLIVVNLHFRGDKRTEVPGWLRKLAIHHGARLLFVNVGPPGGKPPPQQQNQNQNKKSNSKESTQNRKNMCCPLKSDCLLNNKNFFNQSSLQQDVNNIEDNAHHHRSHKACYGNNWSHGGNCEYYRHYIPVTQMPTYPNEYNQSDLNAQFRQLDMRKNMYSGKKTSLENKPNSFSFCPACAGLAAVGASGLYDSDLNRESSHLQLMSKPRNIIHDPTDELALLWNSAFKQTAKQRLSNYLDEDEDDDGGDNDDEDEDEMRESDSSDDDTEMSDHICTDMKSTQNRKELPSNLDKFLLECIGPGASKSVVPNHRFKSNSQKETVSSPFYSFQSPICIDDQTDGETSPFATPNYNTDHNIHANHHNNNNNNNNDSKTLDEIWKTNSLEQQIQKNSNKYANYRLLKRIYALKKDVSDIVKGIHFIQKQNLKKESANKIVTEWRAVGMVLDRLFFVTYLLVLSISIMLYFPRSGDDFAE